MAVFNAVAEAGSFRGAAKTLGLSPSVVSHHITQLEARFGIALLYRTTRKVSLTDAGHELLHAARDMTVAAERGLAAMNRRADEPVGKLKITCPTVMEQSPYIDVFLEFSRAHPRVELDMHYTMRTVELEGSDFDLAFRGVAFGLDDSSYMSRRILELKFLIVASPSYLNSKSIPRTVTDILTWDRIQFPPVPASAMYSFFGVDRSVRIPDPRLQCDSAEAARRYMVAGLGYGVLDINIVRDDLEAGRLVQLLPDTELPNVVMWALWPANVGPDSLARRFIDFTAPKLAKLGSLSLTPSYPGDIR